MKKLFAVVLLFLVAACGSSGGDDEPESNPDPSTIIATVTNQSPSAGASDVDRNASVTLSFSEDISGSATEIELELSDNGAKVPGSTTISQSTLTFVPDAILDFSKNYQVTVQSSPTSDITVANYNWNFTTLIDSVPAPTTSKPFNLVSFNSTGQVLVTIGIPFAPGALSSTNELRIFDNNGIEVAIFVEPTLQWHFKPAPLNTIRAVKVQFNAVIESGQELIYSWDITQIRTLDNDITETDVSQSEFATDVSGKGGVSIPRVVAIHAPDYLSESQIIPPFSPQQNDNQQNYITEQFNWAKDLNFETSTLANWLFDRVTAIYKVCMRNGDAACYREAAQSYRYWSNGLIRNGVAAFPDCAGGLIINGSSVTKACDTKYLYLEPIKLHTALTGIDTDFSDKIFLKKMALLAEEPYYQGRNTDPYDVDEGFTERSAGLTLLAKVIAFELLPEHTTTLLENINQRVDVLYNMQTANPDGFANDGSLRHSWARHEGATYPGNLSDDRRFSPWMSENSADALWQLYQSQPFDNIKTVLLGLGRAVLNWGFSDSQGYLDRFGSDLSNLPSGESWRSSCSNTPASGTKPIVLYSGSSVASSNALIQTQNSEGWYSDSHNPETVLVLAMGYHFATDATEKQKFRDLIELISESYFTAACGGISSTKRKFNWNNRSNPWATYLFLIN